MHGAARKYVTVNPNTKTSTLSINEIERADAGVYGCSLGAESDSRSLIVFGLYKFVLESN